MTARMIDFSCQIFLPGFRKYIVISCSFNCLYGGYVGKIKKDQEEADPVNKHPKKYNRLSTKLITSLAKYAKH